jgi:hypothetical protein
MLARRGWLDEMRSLLPQEVRRLYCRSFLIADLAHPPGVFPVVLAVPLKLGEPVVLA